MDKLILNLPQNVNIIIWKKSKNEDFLNIFLYNQTKEIKFCFEMKKNVLRFDKNTNSMIITRNVFVGTNNRISKFFFNFIKSWNVYYFGKIKFKGKGFRMRFFKKNKFVKFFFGRSHKTFILFKNLKMKRINKYKFILKSIKKNKIIVNSKIATNIKPMNVYTLRGIRKSRQTIYKRKGKKGTYI